MSKEPICCPPRYDRFLAETKTMPFEPEIPRKTLEEKQEARRQAIACLAGDKKIQFEI